MTPPPRAMAHLAPTQHRFHTVQDDQGKRLDQVLAAHVPGLSRRQARVLLDIGGVFVDGARVKVAGRLVREGQTIVAHLGGALRRATKEVGQKARARDEASLPPPRVVHQDDDIAVVEKPAGLLTAPTPESDRQNLAALLERMLGGPLQVVHRLDLETSGLLVFARTPRANRILSDRIRAHDFERVYLAVLQGTLPFEERTVDSPVEGRRAVTHFTVVERIGALATLVRCRLETGRTHQIRLHARALGHPVLGDHRHGERTAFDPPRMALHATRLGLAHPHTGEPLQFDSPLPEDLSSWLDACRHKASVVAGE